MFIRTDESVTSAWLNSVKLLPDTVTSLLCEMRRPRGSLLTPPPRTPRKTMPLRRISLLRETIAP
jgi:hypothetical protein